jgi:hypothetical protein
VGGWVKIGGRLGFSSEVGRGRVFASISFFVFHEVSAAQKEFLMKHIRIEAEHDALSSSYGMIGTCTKVMEATQELVITDDRGPQTVPISSAKIRSEAECANQEFFSFKSVSYIQKLCMVYEVSGWEPEASIEITPVTQAKPARLEGEHLKVWSVVLQATFKRTPFKWFDQSVFLPQVWSAEPVDTAVQESMRMVLQKKRLLLFPIHCPESTAHALGHWTLLAVERSHNDEILVRYYETLNEMNETCKERAKKALSILGVSQDELVRHNCFRQKSDECTECVMHYAELEVRNLAGEGWGSVSCLHPYHRTLIRKTLSRFQHNLEPVRKEWVIKSEIEDTKKKVMRSAVENKVGQIAILDLELQKLRDLCGAVAKLIHEHDAELPPLHLPRPEKKSKVIKNKRLTAKSKPDKVSEPTEEPATDEPDVQEDEAAEAPASLDVLVDFPSKGGAPESAVGTIPSEGGASESIAAEQDNLEGWMEEILTDEPAVETVPVEPQPKQEAAQPLLEQVLLLSLRQKQKLQSEQGQKSDQESAEVATPAAEIPAVVTPAEAEASASGSAGTGTPAAVETPVAAEASASGSAGAQLIHSDEELDPETAAKMSELSEAHQKFDTWIKGVSIEQKEKIIQYHYKPHKKYAEFCRYLAFVKAHETSPGCSKCRGSLRGCLKCSFSQAQNYLLRNAKLPEWWVKSKDHVLWCAG